MHWRFFLLSLALSVLIIVMDSSEEYYHSILIFGTLLVFTGGTVIFYKKRSYKFINAKQSVRFMFLIKSALYGLLLSCIMLVGLAPAGIFFAFESVTK